MSSASSRAPHLQELHARILRQEVPRPRLAHDGIDEDQFRDVGDALLAGRLVPVLGVELDALAAQITHRFDYPSDAPRDLTRVAQYVALTKGAGPLYDVLRGLLAASAEPTAMHRFFASLPSILRERGAPFARTRASCAERFRSSSALPSSGCGAKRLVARARCSCS